MLTVIQRAIVALLKAKRDDAVYVAGGAALNFETPRLSDDLDMFGKCPDNVTIAAHRDLRILASNGYEIDMLKDLPGWVEIVAKKDGSETGLQWIWDDEWQFLPIQEDPNFGFAFHRADLAVNKVTAAFGRRRARDYIDLVLIDQGYAPLGAFIWAAVGKIRRADLTPITIVDELRRRSASHPVELYQSVAMANGVDPVELIRHLPAILDAAEDYVLNRAPVEHWGCLFLSPNGHPAAATKADLEAGKVAPVEVSQYGMWPRFGDLEWMPPVP